MTRTISKLATTYLGYRRKLERCSYAPTRVWIEATSHCNLQCSFCGNRLLTTDQRGFMDMDLYRDLADQASGRIGQLNLFHRGESLLHPGIGEMARYAGRRGIRTRINTNGLVLTRDLSRDLVESQLDMLSFSFDGYDREMYEANRPGSNYDAVLTNIMELLQQKKNMNSKRPFVSLELMEISDLPHPELMRKRHAFLRRFHGLPLDKFVIRRPHNWAGLIETGKENTVKSRIACPLLWHAMVVFWDGRVMPCPQDFFGALRIGDARNQGLMEIWNGDLLRSLRREMADPMALQRHPCVDCDRIMRATIAGVPVDYLGRFLSETVFGNSWLSRILPH
jgi:radical SAM protein with 4Fe4S-binding SPASM domain